MRNGDLKAGRHSKKGITLVELIVAMTLTSIFAVLCVMLINPIERTYRGTLKLARAQLLADTLIDSIRKECDDVRHDEKADVWITDLSGDDDGDLFNYGPANKASSGNTIVFRRNNNYTEAIYAGVKISDTNKDNVTNNPLTPNNTSHSIDTLINSGAENLNKGIVHFGYYQAKEDERGIFPIESYDYTNPVMAKTYGDFRVSLRFYDLTYREDKYPAYVMCEVSVIEKSSVIYKRSAVLCFAANGSGKGSGSHNVNPPSVRDIEVNVVWDDNQATDLRPQTGLTFTLRNNNSTVIGTHTVSDVRSSDTQRFVFKNINTTNGYGLAIAPNTIPEYDRTIKKTANGYLVTYSRAISVMLIPGPQFNAILKDHNRAGITSFVFATNDDAHMAMVQNASFSCNVALDTKTNQRVSDYKLYLVPDNSAGTYIAYVLTNTEGFVGNPDMSCMFESCLGATQFSGLELINTSNTVDMHRMFKNCRKWTNATNYISLPGWNTSKVEAFDSMFYNVATDDSITENITINVSNFDFQSAHYYKQNGGDGKEVIGINKLFYADYGSGTPDVTSHVGTIIFGEGAKDMNGVNMLQETFAGLDNLTEIRNFNNISFNTCERFTRTFMSCPKLESADFSNWNLPNERFTSVDEMFNGLSGLKTINLNKLNIPNVSSVNGMFKNLGSLERVNLDRMNAPLATSVTLFKSRKKLLEVSMNNCTIGSNAAWSAESMFFDCTSLKKVSLNNLINSNCTSLKQMFYNCNVLDDITGLKSWATTSVTNFSQMFFNCGSGITSNDFEIDVSGFGFNNTDGVSIDMSSMFNGSGASKIVFPSTGGVKNATTIAGMFQNCKKLSEVENFILNTDEHTDAAAPELSFPNCTDIHNLFTYCSEFKNVKMNISVPSCQSIYYLFANCSNLVSLDLSKSDFSGCKKLQNFLNPCSALKTLYLNDVNLSNCQTSAGGFTNMFSGCGSLNYLYMNGINLDGATDFTFLPWSNPLKELYMKEASLAAMTIMEGRFKDKKFVELIDISDAKFGAYDQGDNYLSASLMFSNCTNLKTIVAKGFKGTVNLSSMFSGCTSLTSIDFERWDTSRTTNMSNMFYNCSSMTEFDLSALDTRNVTTMEGMFDSCSSAHGFDSTGWANWSTSKVTTMKNMFHYFGYKSGVTERYTVNISNFDFSNCKSFYQMFSCDEKEPSAKDTISKIILPAGSNCVIKAAAGSTETYRMFRNRWRLTTIENVQYFSSEVKITDAQSTFAGTSLTELDISAFDFDKVVTDGKKAQWMFNENYKLEKIYVKADCDYDNFSSKNSGVEMFKLDTKLEGPNGTKYVTQNNDMLGKRARIDEDGKPGYFRVR